MAKNTTWTSFQKKKKMVENLKSFKGIKTKRVKFQPG